MSSINEHVVAIVEQSGLKLDDVISIEITPGRIKFTVVAREEDGEVAMIHDHFPLHFDVIGSLDQPDHEH